MVLPTQINCDAEIIKGSLVGISLFWIIDILNSALHREQSGAKSINWWFKEI